MVDRHDSEPSFLQHAVLSTEPSNKKARLSEPASDRYSIASRLAASSYASLQDLRKDAGTVSDDLVTAIRTKARERADFTAGRPTVEELKQINKIQSLETLVQEIVERERGWEEPGRLQIGKEEKDTVNGTCNQKVSSGSTRGGTVLTLFGNAPTPKQLFSSQQHPSDRDAPLIKTELPVEEMSLPNGISTTKIASVFPDEVKKGPTFEQAFAPPYSLAALQPPKSHKRAVARDHSITWEFKDPTQRNKRGGYTVQPLSTATWLDYGGVDDSTAVSTRERRKQRDRALSSSDGTARKDTSETSVEILKRQEEALFRKAYSSFAPPKDSSNTIVPEELKNMVWWQKVGEKRYYSAFAIDPALLNDPVQPQVPDWGPTPDLREDEFSQVLEDLDQLEKMETEAPIKPNKDKTDVEQVLREVSELLETLASHQRIRNASLHLSTTASRTPISPGPAGSTQSGKPDEPSEQETATYHTLRRELAYLLLKLPPYAIAKLDGDQLADLGVKTLVAYEIADVRGVMEEDQVARQAKLAAMATANSIASLARPSSSAASQRYNHTPQGTPAIGALAHTRYGTSYNARTPSVATPTFQRQQSNPSTFGTAPNVRPSYSVQPQQFTRPGAPQPGYGNTVNQQYYGQRNLPQQSNGGYSSYAQQYQATAQNQSTPLQNQAYARTLSVGNFQTNNTPPQQIFNRNASPAKPSFPPQQAGAQRPMYPAPQQPQQQQQQQQQPGSGRATPVSYPSNPHTPVNGYAPPPPRPIQELAPRPTSTTPQPPQHNGPTQPPPH